MNTLKFVSLCAAAALMSVACAEKPVDEAEAPEVALEDVDMQDMGTSWNGWSQGAWVEIGFCSGINRITSDFARYSGDSTRGGGVCLVQQWGTACTNDSDCTAYGQSMLGPSVYGYCVSGSCNVRPGSQADWCTLNPNRGPGMLHKYVGGGVSNYGVVGCMTKTAGPNTACGGTNQSLYMRVFNPDPAYQVDGCE
jgi:hypothetical protein